MIDYEHPTILRLIDACRIAYDANIVLDDCKRARVKPSTDILQVLSGAVGIASECHEEMKLATNIPSEDKSYYLDFIPKHTQRLEKWYRECSEIS